MRTIVWFRGKDLRISDRASLRSAASAGEVLPPVAVEIADQSVPIPSCQDLGITSNPRLQTGGERAARGKLRAFLLGPAADYVDPNGNYVSRWVPELAKMPAKHIHCPWEAPDTALEEAGVKLGDNYPRPVVDHKAARQLYLDAAGAHLKGGKRLCIAQNMPGRSAHW